MESPVRAPIDLSHLYLRCYSCSLRHLEARWKSALERAVCERKDKKEVTACLLVDTGIMLSSCCKQLLKKCLQVHGLPRFGGKVSTNFDSSRRMFQSSTISSSSTGSNKVCSILWIVAFIVN